MNILVVDDDELILATVPDMVAYFGHHVLTASKGEDALQCIQANPDLDLVILDLSMPGMSGIEILQRLRQFRKELPVLIASGYLDAKTQEILKLDGKALNISKPFTMAELNRMFEEVGKWISGPRQSSI